MLKMTHTHTQKKKKKKKQTKDRKLQGIIPKKIETYMLQALHEGKC